MTDDQASRRYLELRFEQLHRSVASAISRRRAAHSSSHSDGSIRGNFRLSAAAVMEIRDDQGERRRSQVVYLLIKYVYGQ